jgi:hypothetical protein
MISELRTPVPGQGFSKCDGKLTNCLDEGVHDDVCSLLREFNQDDEPRSPLD